MQPNELKSDPFNGPVVKGRVIFFYMHVQDAEMLPLKELSKLLVGRIYSVVEITLAQAENGRRYKIRVLRHLPGPAAMF